jgi:hypothetical protein
MLRELAKVPGFVTAAAQLETEAAVKRKLDGAVESIFGSIERAKTPARQLAKSLGRPRVHEPAVTPPEPVATSARRPTGAGVWIEADIKRLRADGEIPDGVRKTEFSKLLANRMSKAADSNGFVSLPGTDKPVRVVGWRHIKNSLPIWGLWPPPI